MGYTDGGSPKGGPLFNDIPQTVADLNAGRAYTELVGNRKVGTTSERNAATGSNVWAGLEWYDTTLKRTFTYDGSAWVSSQDGQPFAMASGSGSNAAGAATTITFPAGRFTVPPNIVGSTYGSGVRAFQVVSVTTSSAVVGGYDFGGNAVASTWRWTATQMTATTANG